MKILIKSIKGKPLEIEVSEGWTVEELKKKVLELTNVAVIQQKLIFSGKALVKDTQSLAECGIQDQATLTLMITKVSILCFLRPLSSQSPHSLPTLLPESSHQLPPHLSQHLHLPLQQACRLQDQNRLHLRCRV